MRAFRSPDGTQWGVEIRTPGSSNAMVVFHHPDPATSARNRYAWYLAPSAVGEHSNARLVPARVLEALTDRDLALLFRRSMPISSQVPRFEPG